MFIFALYLLQLMLNANNNAGSARFVKYNTIIILHWCIVASLCFKHFLISEFLHFMQQMLAAMLQLSLL